MIKPHPAVTVAVILGMAAAAWALIIYICWAIITSGIFILEIITRSIT